MDSEEKVSKKKSSRRRAQEGRKPTSLAREGAPRRAPRARRGPPRVPGARRRTTSEGRRLGGEARGGSPAAGRRGAAGTPGLLVLRRPWANLPSPRRGERPIEIGGFPGPSRTQERAPGGGRLSRLSPFEITHLQSAPSATGARRPRSVPPRSLVAGRRDDARAWRCGPPECIERGGTPPGGGARRREPVRRARRTRRSPPWPWRSEGSPGARGLFSPSPPVKFSPGHIANSSQPGYMNHRGDGSDA